MNGNPSGGELLLRGLASGDDNALRAALALKARPAAAPISALPPQTASLIRVAALLAADASTTSLRWAVEMALEAGARDEEIVDVLVTMAAALGSARVVAAAPRLALAIGYDIEVEGWDGC